MQTPTMTQDWCELKRRWKQFLAALFSIRADDLARPERREVTGLTKPEAREMLVRQIETLKELSELALASARKGGLAEIKAASEIIRENAGVVEKLLAYTREQGRAGR